MAKFKEGEIVQLKSGGPKMTIKEVFGADDKYMCQWFAGSKLNEGFFTQESLIKVEDDQSKDE